MQNKNKVKFIFYKKNLSELLKKDARNKQVHLDIFLKFYFSYTDIFD